MFRQLLTCVFLFCAWAGAAQATSSINGGWSVNNGDLLFLMKATKGGPVLAVELKTDKTVRYFFQGTLDGNALSVKTRDGSTTLEGTLNGDRLSGNLTEAGQSTDFKATHNFAYKGSAYDGLWQLDGNERYFLYATLTLQGMPTVIAPYFALSDSGRVTSHNVYMGGAAKIDEAGIGSFAGLSLVDFTAFRLNFPNSGIANGALIENQDTVKVTAMRIYRVSKKSGQY